MSWCSSGSDGREGVGGGCDRGADGGEGVEKGLEGVVVDVCHGGGDDVLDFGSILSSTAWASGVMSTRTRRRSLGSAMRLM